MKVILQQDVAKIGRRLDVAEVPDGYALNMLIPTDKAEAATPENLKKRNAQVSKQGSSAAADADALAVTVEALKTDVLEIVAEANEQEHLFEAIKAEAIAEAAAKRDLALGVADITIAEPIKSLGEHEIAIGQAKVTITVVAK